MLEIQNLFAGYNGVPILKDVSACFEKGEITFIIGINGSGKSTLLRALLGIIPLMSGKVLIDGISSNELSARDIARRVAYLAQEKNVPDMTVMQMVLHGRFPHLNYFGRYSQADKEIARLAIERVGLSELSGAPLSHLSGGMRQNAYLAMALAQSTDYILLDEPTTYLDISHQLDLMRLISSVSKRGKGIVTVMHDLPLAFDFSDKIILVDSGEIIAADQPHVISKMPVIRKKFGAEIYYDEKNGHYTRRYSK
ncbi:MAG: ABC transporter ATP-binding protein [Clostridia bacterium]|nr:ABC transporter ATP-binding protein [Clostridia bacterium]